METSDWYDRLATVYDTFGVRQYAPMRREAVRRLRVRSGDRVLDFACGTGANFGLIFDELGGEGELVGLDASAGMLERARRRIEREQLTEERVELVCADGAALAIGADPSSDIGTFDRVLCTLGITVVPNWRGVVRGLVERTRPGGRIALMDAYFENAPVRRALVDWVADSAIDRPFWEPVEAECRDIDRETFRFPWLGGGEIVVVSGRVPENDERRS